MPKIKYPSPSKEYLLEQLAVGRGKYHIAKDNGVTIPVVVRWLKEHDIKVARYHGRRRFRFPTERLEEFKLDHKSLTLTQLARKYVVHSITIQLWCKELSLPLPKTQGQYWKRKNQEAIDLIDEIIRLNKSGVTIKQLSLQFDVSVEYIDNAIKKYGYEVKLHTYNKSTGEKALRDYVRSLGFSCDSIKRTFDGRLYEIDCFVEEKNFGIEFNGEYWHSDEQKGRRYHHDKKLWCMKQGIFLFSIYQHEWEVKKPLIQAMIRNRLGLAKRIMARECVVGEVPSDLAFMFHLDNHIQGAIHSKINYGLWYADELVSVMSFSKSRYGKDGMELTRYSNLHDVCVVGGASKLLKCFERRHECIELVSYADLRISDGRLYELLGFEKGLTAINYFYYHDKTKKFESRLKYQKHKLASLLMNYDPLLTEKENMRRNKYRIIYDYGTVTYKKVYTR